MPSAFFNDDIELNILDGKGVETMRVMLDENTQDELEKAFRKFVKSEHSEVNFTFIDAVNKTLNPPSGLSEEDQIAQWLKIYENLILRQPLQSFSTAMTVTDKQEVNLPDKIVKKIQQALGEEEPLNLESIQNAFKDARAEIIKLLTTDSFRRFQKGTPENADYKSIISEVPEVREKLEQRELKAQALAEEQEKMQQLKEEQKNAELQKALAAQKQAQNELRIAQKEEAPQQEKQDKIEEKIAILLITSARVRVETQKLAVGLAAEKKEEAELRLKELPNNNPRKQKLQICTAASEEAEKELVRAKSSLKKREDALTNLPLVRQVNAMEVLSKALRERQKAQSEMERTAKMLEEAQKAASKRYITLFRKDDKEVAGASRAAQAATEAFQAALQLEHKAQENVNRINSQVGIAKPVSPTQKETSMEPPSPPPATPTQALANAAQATQEARRASVSGVKPADTIQTPEVTQSPTSEDGRPRSNSIIRPKGQ